MDIYNSLLPAWTNNVKCLKSVCRKAEHHALHQEYDPEVLLLARLFPDMFPFIRQVQVVSDLYSRAGARLSQSELPSFSDDETSFEDLYSRLDRTLIFVDGLDEAGFAGAESRELEIPFGGDTTRIMSGEQYITGFVIPNLYFHLTTAYNILRANGIPLGKRDFLIATE